MSKKYKINPKAPRIIKVTYAGYDQGIRPFRDIVQEVESHILICALQMYESKRIVARVLDISPYTLRNRMRKYNLEHLDPDIKREHISTK